MIDRDANRSSTTRRRSVLLEHALPDGSTHVDWLLALESPPAPDARCVRTWRIDGRIDLLEPGSSVTGVRIADHRALYLHHEGWVALGAAGTDRGSVRRIAIGSALIEELSETILTLRIDWRDPQGQGAIIPMRLRVADAPSRSMPAVDGDIMPVTVTRVDGSTAQIPRRTA